jgi:hypothetical protein
VNGVFHVDENAYDDFMGRYAVRLAPLFAEFAGVEADSACSTSVPARVR